MHKELSLSRQPILCNACRETRTSKAQPTVPQVRNILLKDKTGIFFNSCSFKISTHIFNECRRATDQHKWPSSAGIYYSLHQAFIKTTSVRVFLIAPGKLFQGSFLKRQKFCSVSR